MKHHHFLFLPKQGLIMGTNLPKTQWEPKLSLGGSALPPHLSISALTHQEHPYHWVRPVPKAMTFIVHCVFTTPLIEHLKGLTTLAKCLWLGLLATAATLANPSHRDMPSGLTQLRQLNNSLELPRFATGHQEPQHLAFASRKHSIQVLPVPTDSLDSGQGTIATQTPWLLALDLHRGHWFALSPKSFCAQEGIFELEPNYLFFVVGPRKPLPWKAVDPKHPCAPPTPLRNENPQESMEEGAL